MQPEHQVVQVQPRIQELNTTIQTTPTKPITPPNQIGMIDNNSDDIYMTLNRLNAPETEVDVESLSSEVKIDFDSEVTG